MSEYLKISIIDTPLAEADGRDFTTYILQIDGFNGVDVVSKVVPKRFSEIDAFHKILSSQFACLPPLPSKTLVPNTDAEFVKRRSRSLQSYFDRIVQRLDVMRSAHLRHFLEFGDDVASPAVVFHSVTKLFGQIDCSSVGRATLFVDDNVLVIGSGSGNDVLPFVSAIKKFFSSDNEEDAEDEGRVDFFSYQDDMSSARLCVSLPHGVTCMTYDTERRWLCCGTRGGTVQIINPSPDTSFFVEIMNIELSNSPVVALHYNSPSNLLIGVTNDGSLHVFDMENQLMLSSVRCVNGQCCTYMEETRYALVGDTTGSVSVFNTSSANKEPLFKWQLHDGGIQAIAYHQNNIICGSTDSTLSVWVLGTNENFDDTRRIAVLHGHKYPITNVEVSHNGLHAISTDSEGYVVVWSLRGMTSVVAFRAHADSITSVSVHKNGFVATTSRDKCTKVWDMKSLLVGDANDDNSNNGVAHD